MRNLFFKKFAWEVEVKSSDDVRQCVEIEKFLAIFWDFHLFFEENEETSASHQQLTSEENSFYKNILKLWRKKNYLNMNYG